MPGGVDPPIDHLQGPLLDKHVRRQDSGAMSPGALPAVAALLAVAPFRALAACGRLAPLGLTAGARWGLHAALLLGRGSRWRGMTGRRFDSASRAGLHHLRRVSGRRTRHVRGPR